MIAAPVGDPVQAEEAEARTSANQLFELINEGIKREINKEIKDESIEVGDNIKKDDGFSISIQHISSVSSFPISFKPKDEDILDDKKIITLVNDFDGSAEYELVKKDESAKVPAVTKKVEISTKAAETSTITAETKKPAENATPVTDFKIPAETTAKPGDKKKSSLTTTEPETTTTQKSSITQSTESQSTTNKTHQLLKDIAEEPVILSHV